ncbi:MAG: hypothetical protein J6S67_05955 [Methanobrevibacter sp.]|nr:hypothetical protein [Methanobrevibacter sp.]
MVHLYEILNDKYGDYYVSYNKKHRLKTLDKNGIKYQIVNVFEKRYIQFG